MSDTETFVFLGFICIAIPAWWRWYRFVFSIRAVVPVGLPRLLVALAPLAAFILLWLTLITLASSDVRDNFAYIAFYLLMGIAWLGIAVLFFPFAGISARDDVVERRNNAAAYAVCGALIGLMLCFAGGNIGNGPGWWVVVYSAALSSIALFVLWIGLQVLTRISDTVTIGRDTAAGLRLAGFLIAAGLVLARAVAGDWPGYFQTILDFVRFGWPVLVIVLIAVLAEFVFRPTVEHPYGSPVLAGLLPGIVYIGLALVVLALEPLSVVMPR